MRSFSFWRHRKPKGGRISNVTTVNRQRLLEKFAFKKGCRKLHIGVRCKIFLRALSGDLCRPPQPRSNIKTPSHTRKHAREDFTNIFEADVGIVLFFMYDEAEHAARWIMRFSAFRARRSKGLKWCLAPCPEARRSWSPSPSVLGANAQKTNVS